jgi:hypothetical protein
MDFMVTISIIMILLAIALYLPPLFLIMLIVASPRFGIAPVIIYMFLISIIYAIKRRGKV